MSPEETPEVEQPVPKKAAKVAKVEDAPMTKEEVVAQMKRLGDRAKAAGLSPLKILVETYAKRGMTIVESLFDALEDAEDKPKGKRSRAKGK